MLNYQQYLLLCAIEELGEIQKELLKCLRFTPENDSYDGVANIERVNAEMSDFEAICDLLKTTGLELRSNPIQIEDKKRRLKVYLNISKELGVLR
jgi:hypothetical protein